jgi:hypothetical protein
MAEVSIPRAPAELCMRERERERENRDVETMQIKKLKFAHNWMPLGRLVHKGYSL